MIKLLFAIFSQILLQWSHKTVCTAAVTYWRQSPIQSLWICVCAKEHFVNIWTSETQCCVGELGSKCEVDPWTACGECSSASVACWCYGNYQLATV